MVVMGENLEQFSSTKQYATTHRWSPPQYGGVEDRRGHEFPSHFVPTIPRIHKGVPRRSEDPGKTHTPNERKNGGLGKTTIPHRPTRCDGAPSPTPNEPWGVVSHVVSESREKTQLFCRNPRHREKTLTFLRKITRVSAFRTCEDCEKYFLQ